MKQYTYINPYGKTVTLTLKTKCELPSIYCYNCDSENCEEGYKIIGYDENEVTN